MSLFRTKEKVSTEAFCKEFYEQVYLHPQIEGQYASTVFVDQLWETLREGDAYFDELNKLSFYVELQSIQFEIFALAWVHKLSGKFALKQSVFTYEYLSANNKSQIWSGMEYYNQYVDSAVLNWLTDLGKANMNFWYGVREDLTKKNNELAVETNANNEALSLVNNRLCSENAWNQGLILKAIVYALSLKIHLDLSQLKPESVLKISFACRGLYDGVVNRIQEVKIIS